MIFTLFARSRPCDPVAERSTSSSTCSAPRRAPTRAPPRPARSKPRLGRAPVDREIVGRDDRVLPGRDPERVEVGLRAFERRKPLVLSGDRQQALDELGGALVERARRRAVGVPLDPPAERVGRVAA